MLTSALLNAIRDEARVRGEVERLVEIIIPANFRRLFQLRNTAQRSREMNRDKYTWAGRARGQKGEMTYALDMQKPYLLCTSPVSAVLTVSILATSASTEAPGGDGGRAPRFWHRPPAVSSARTRRRNSTPGSGLGGMELADQRRRGFTEEEDRDGEML